MRSTRGAFYALAVLGGYFAWRNRFAIQRQLESMGLRTPILAGGIGESARSIAAKVAGKFDRGTTIAEQSLDQDRKDVVNY